MNVTVYPEACSWLFGQCKPEQGRLWSFGRHEPACGIGDDLIFRLDGTPVGRAIVRWVRAPGELDVEMFDGSRVLRGWKLIWLHRDFEDLRGKKLGPLFGRPLTETMQMLLESGPTDGRIELGAVLGRELRALRGLVDRGLATFASAACPRFEGVLTREGWRAVLRLVNERRIRDIASREPVCRICGCTPNDACEGGCSWADEAETLCSRCELLSVPVGVPA